MLRAPTRHRHQTMGGKKSTWYFMTISFILIKDLFSSLSLISFPLIYSIELCMFWNTYEDECKEAIQYARGNAVVFSVIKASLSLFRPSVPLFLLDLLILLPASSWIIWYSILLCLIAHLSDHLAHCVIITF